MFQALTRSSYFWHSAFATQTSSSYNVDLILASSNCITCGNIDLQEAPSFPPLVLFLSVDHFGSVSFWLAALGNALTRWLWRYQREDLNVSLSELLIRIMDWCREGQWWKGIPLCVQGWVCVATCEWMSFGIENTLLCCNINKTKCVDVDFILGCCVTFLLNCESVQLSYTYLWMLRDITESDLDGTLASQIADTS